jgi:hypothetical protein
MRKNLFFMATVMLTALILGCGGKAADKGDSTNDSVVTTLPGDSTIYGLACDGCTDTILVLLRDVTQDPDTFDILDASRNQRVFGHPNIGDQMAVVLTSDSTNVADMVIDIDKILGSWCYKVTPTLRRRADVDKAMEQEFLKKMPDSVIRRLLQPREYGFELKNDFQAQPIGMVRRGNTSDDRTPVEYPELKRYREWRLFNGRLILNETRRDSLNQQQLVSSDTADFVLLRRDSLVLRFADGEHGYYRKSEEATIVK